MSRVAIVLGDGLHRGLPGLPAGIPIFMREDRELATRVRHHRQKLVLFFSAMRHFAESERASGREVYYRRYDEPSNYGSLLEAVAALRPREVWCHYPHDRYFATRIQSWAREEGIALRLVPSPSFLTDEIEWRAYRGNNANARRRNLMGDFYVRQRKRLGLLIDEYDRPEGGHWTYDTENRLPLPQNVLPSAWVGAEPDSITREVIAMVDRDFPDHPGLAAEFAYAVDHAGAEAALLEFIDERLDRFGPYEDAIPQRERVLFHSVLSPYLNCGLLTPIQVVEAVLKAYRIGGIPISSAEGFLRQVIGWREFIHATDRWDYGDRGWGEEEPYPNFFGGKRKLAPVWWSGETGLPPLDMVIHRTLRHAWSHHIERLMIVGSVMTMCSVDPEEMYRWFMEMYIDSADWVMAPNVFGLSGFADGGLFATKPYISGSNYILKMSDWRRGPWCDIWDGLYWGFILKHQEFFRMNTRTSATAAAADRLEPRRRETILAAAAEFIDRVTVAP